MTEIPIQIIEHLSSANLLRCQIAEAKYKQVTKVQRDVFISQVKAGIEKDNFYLTKNDYPYNVFCDDTLEHWVLFVNPNFFTNWNWKRLLENNYPDFDFFFVNTAPKQSIKEIQHIHLFKKVWQ